MSVTGRRTSRPSSRQGPGSGGPPPLVAVIGEYELSLSEVLNLFLTAFLLPRPPSPSKKRVVSSVVSPATSTSASSNEFGGSGSARGQSASVMSGVPKVIKPKKFVLNQSSQ